MIDPAIVLVVFCLYMGLLLIIALWVEHQSATGQSIADHPLVYSLSIAVYCTAWTYYGSVGQAASSGMLFVPIFLGPSLMMFLGWTVLRRLVRLKTIHRITSIADFVSARYYKSQLLAFLVTLIAFFGIMPYIALQLKAIISTFQIITAPTSALEASSWIGRHIGPVVVAFMILFTIILGVRRQDPTERHKGMMAALAVECVVKLFAFLVAGIFVTYFIYDGITDLFEQLGQSPYRNLLIAWQNRPAPYLTWTTYLILSMSAILFLPRQFHVAVVENADEKHILTAMWVFPLYLLLINIFVIPIAAAGLLQGHPVDQADSFVLTLPFRHGSPWLSLLVFIGGFSAAAGMIMISSVTMATMITNHVLLPLMEGVRRLGFLRRHLLKCRWAAVAGFILIGYWFEEYIGETYPLINIGLLSFACVLQFAPVMLGGLFWRRGNQMGALLGLASGFLIWLYTLLLPSFVKSGWGDPGLLDRGPWGLAFLKPHQLFGMTDLDPLCHTVLWSMFFNVGLYVLGSLAYGESEEERSQAEEFIHVLNTSSGRFRGRSREAYISLAAKMHEIEALLSRYFPAAEAKTLVERAIQESGIDSRKGRISIVQLVELHSIVEKSLAGVIGAAAAHKALHQGTIFTRREAQELSEVYGEILADLKVTPSELKHKIDYYQEREMLLVGQARELEEKVEALKKEIFERRRVQEALRESEERYRRLVETMNEGLEMEDENGVITYVNERLCRMWGCSREEIVGYPVTRFLDPSQWKTMEEEMEKRRRGEISSYETTWAGKDGEKISTIVSCVPIHTEGQYKGSFAVITDISQIKALEREKANLISMFAHDMRSSLTGIHGLGLRLLNKASSMDEEKRNEYLRIINKEASKLESLVDDFLEFSRLETGRLRLNFRATSLDRELLEMAEAYRVKAAQSDLALEIHLDEMLPILNADVNRLRRVFTNLLDNAIKFSKSQGTIKIIAQELNQEVMVRIMDEGVGIDPAELPYIFDLFHRGQSAQKKEGYGIGLATVKSIVEGHGGRIHVASEPGKGSVFTVFLPKGMQDKAL